MQIYGHLKHYGKIVELYGAFKKAGVSKTGEPRLAIVRADAQWVHLYKTSNGGGIFSIERKDSYDNKPDWSEGDIELPSQTFPWNADDFKPYEKEGKSYVKQLRYVKTLVPIIPPRVEIATSMRIVPYHYHILFEAETWANDP